MSTSLFRSRNSYGTIIDNDADVYEMSMVGPAQLNVAAVYQSEGTYEAQYVPTIVGTYDVSVRLLNKGVINAPDELYVHVVGSPYTLKVQPGEVAPANCDTSVVASDLLDIESGNTYRFTINLRDIYNNNLLVGDAKSVIKILAIYEDHSEWPSPIAIDDLYNWDQLFGVDVVGLASDNLDGTYHAQLTVYRAGSYSLEVTINDQHVQGSPWDALKVHPTGLYAPSCVVQPLSIATSMVAGTQYTFLIQTRDFYSNNM